MQLVLDTSGIQLKKNGKSFLIVGKKGKKTIAPAKLTSIAITANVLFDSSAVKLAIQNQIPILFFDHIGKARARLWSPYFESLATLRREQAKFAESPDATDWMVEIFLLKTQGQIANLELLKKHSLRAVIGLRRSIQEIKKQSRNFESFRTQLPELSRSKMMGVEGNIARVYWQTLGGSLPRKYRFKKRTRRPAEDFYNAALNYYYGMLYSVVESGIFAAGLDPYLGIFHADEYAKPTLSFDMIEPFRTWADYLLIQLCLEEKLDPNFFSKNQYGYFLNQAGKAFLIPHFNQSLRKEQKFLNQTATVKNNIYHLCGLLAKRMRSRM